MDFAKRMVLKTFGPIKLSRKLTVGAPILALLAALQGPPALAAKECKAVATESVQLDAGSFDINIDLDEPMVLSASQPKKSAVWLDVDYSNGLRRSPEFMRDASSRFLAPPRMEAIDAPYSFKKNPFVGASLTPIRYMIQDPALAMSAASMNFIVRGTKSPTKVRLFIVSNKTTKLSKKRGQPTRYEFEFETPAATDWVSVRYSDLKLSNGKNIPFQFVPQTVTGMGFEIIEGHDDVTIESTINFGVDVATDQMEDFIDNMLLREPKTPSSLDGVAPQAIKAVLKKFVASQLDPANQKYAVDVVRAGIPAIRKELAKYGWTVKTEFTDKVEMSKVIFSLSARDLFYEGGPFGPTHGAFVHHAEFIAGFRSLSPQERILMTDFIRYAIADPSDAKRWGMWNAFFDSRGKGSNGNRFWRDLIDGV